ncbi:uncharacterized protein METZ01_LOCUS38966, partial [marine metagenome]
VEDLKFIIDHFRLSYYYPGSQIQLLNETPCEFNDCI